MRGDNDRCETCIYWVECKYDGLSTHGFTGECHIRSTPMVWNPHSANPVSFPPRKPEAWCGEYTKDTREQNAARDYLND